MRYVVGRGDRIAGLLFGYPLQSPPAAGKANKILWVAHHAGTSADTLRIQAVRMVGSRRIGTPIRMRVPHGPGPSIVNLPSSGCWRLTLSWGGTEDSLDLRYYAK